MTGDRLRMSLLPALQALLSTASVTKAAEMMHVTQSTMSHTLGQLRNILNDPILVRDGNRFYLSQKARELLPKVDQLIDGADTIFGDQQFDPASSKQQFRMFTGASFQEQFLSEALARISKQAPGLTFNISVINQDSLKLLEKGQADFCFIRYLSPLPQGLKGQAIFRDASFIVVRKGHPLIDKGLRKLSDLDEYPFLNIDGPMLKEPSIVALKSQSKSLQMPWMSVDNPQAAKVAIKHNNAYCVINGHKQSSDLSDPELVFLPFPVELPDMPFWILWPEYWEFSKAHHWLRKQLEKEVRQIFARFGEQEILVSEPL